MYETFKKIFQAVLKSKTNILSVWKRHISPVRKFLSDKFESIFWVSKTKLWNFFKSMDSRGKHFGKWFWCCITWKANVLSVWKWSCFLFANFWVAKLKPFSGKDRQSLQKWLNWKFLIRSILPALKSKAIVLKVWKWIFLHFLQIFEWRSWDRFLGKQSNAFKTFWFQSLSYEVFQKMVFKLPERAKRMFWMFGNGLTKLRMFSGKTRQRLQKF